MGVSPGSVRRIGSDNATGTPYFQRQPLRDVVLWFGLGQGIRNGVLKPLAGNIKVIDDFATDDWPVALPNGAPGLSRHVCRYRTA